ncbi:hypothetical protein I553_3863 [Mycobacterium xenopi 4042]|uniref:Uncharacterized protein n=1 Tax=Mycobacterium xenopi 4042 TaxID=1299334 RepID=X8AME7_MYCXE|nr:hypothetical protein I553_3863 [Mycobacterium xenopi 4042]
MRAGVCEVQGLAYPGVDRRRRRDRRGDRHRPAADLLKGAASDPPRLPASTPATNPARPTSPAHGVQRSEHLRRRLHACPQVPQDDRQVPNGKTSRSGRSPAFSAASSSPRPPPCSSSSKRYPPMLPTLFIAAAATILGVIASRRIGFSMAAPAHD